MNGSRPEAHGALPGLREDVRYAVRAREGSGRGEAVGAVRRPNVLLLMTDQQRADALSCDGNPAIRTPHLDQLAREGVRCASAYVQNPICMPSRATLFTGRYPRSHRVRTNGVSLPREELTLADVLNASGYRTAAFGKLHFMPSGDAARSGRYEANATWADPALAAGLDDWSGPYYGFQTVKLAIGHNGPGGHYGQWLRREHPEALRLFSKECALQRPSGAPQSWKSALPEALHASTWVADETIDFLRRTSASAAGNQRRAPPPFFVVCSFPDPHHPFCPPAPWCNRYDPAAMPLPVQRTGELAQAPPHFAEHARGAWSRRGPVRPAYPNGVAEAHLREIIAHYYSMVSLLDHNVGRVLDALDALGLAEQTLVVFTSDHGELLGDHGLLFKGPFLYEGLVRVPLLWRLPGRIARGQVLHHLVGHVDVVPTVLDLLEVETPLGIQGQSLASLLAGHESARAAGLRPWVLTEYHTGYEPDLALKQLHTGRYKLTYYGRERFGELYDLEDDPHEFVNRFRDPAYATRRRELERQLVDVLMATEDPLPPQTAFA
jgi:arylsulfatase A-like enzyme